MGTRPLRQHYDEVDRYVVDDAVGSIIEPWHRHRTRLLATLRTFDEEQWHAPTHCTDWNARDVVSHLITVDGFWVASLVGARSGTPTKMLPGFDPKSIPELLVVPLRELPSAELLDQFTAGQDAFGDMIDAFEPEDWGRVAESPFGHLPARLALAHAFWDSWVHERDILEPAGRSPAVDGDEAYTAAWFALFFGCAQGGVPGAPGALVPGPDAPIDATLVFAEQPDRPVRAQVGDQVHLSRGSAAAEGGHVVSAVAFVDGFAQRGGASLDALETLPDDLRAQLERGQQTF